MLVDARTMNAHVVENTCELSAFMKGGVMAAGSERDAGFCSGGDEDDNMSGLHSPSASEDSVEVQVTPISLRNKRKLAEPRKIQEPNTAPLKKRRFEQIERQAGPTTTTKTTSADTMESVVQDEESRPAGSPSPSPFRPWSSPATSKNSGNVGNISNNSEAKSSTERSSGKRDDSRDVSAVSSKGGEDDILRIHDESRWIKEENKRREEESRRIYEARIQQEVLTRLQESDRRHQLQLQQRRPSSPMSPQLLLPTSSSSSSVRSVQSQRRDSRQQPRFEPPAPLATSNPLVHPHPRLQEEPLSLVLRGESPRVPAHPAVNGSYDASQHSSTSYNNDHSMNSSVNRDDEHIHETSETDRSGHHPSVQTEQQHQQQQQRNYKNMTRERRIEANARERTRVHTISAAFDTLRRAIPAYSHNQKLSKLSVLRIACSYIMTLSNIANTPEGEPTTSASLGACIDLVSRTIQTEGKLRKKKDE